MYSLRKIKSHIKELEYLVSIRFEEAQLVKFKTADKKQKRKKLRETQKEAQHVKNQAAASPLSNISLSPMGINMEIVGMPNLKPRPS